MNAKIDIHADDYGYSICTSRDILECMKAGRLDSISIICNTKWFDKSMDLLYEAIPELPFLPLISVHLNIPEGISEEPLFPMSWGKLFLSSYSPGRNKVKEALKKDLRMQIDTVKKVTDRCFSIAERNGIEYKQKGLRLDSHIHTHLIPVVWDALTELIDEQNYQIEYIRNPKEPLLPFLKEVSLWKTYAPVNIIKNRILMLYSKKADRYCQTHQLPLMYMWGLMMSGHMDIDRIEKIYPEMEAKAQKDGRCLELLFHPGRAEQEEYSEDMNPDYFRDSNTSENRSVEKHAVMDLGKLTGK